MYDSLAGAGQLPRDYIIMTALLGSVSECYQSLTAHQHQKGHTVPKQVITIKTSNQVDSISTALCESIRDQAKSEQTVRQELIPRVLHGEASLCSPLLG